MGDAAAARINSLGDAAAALDPPVRRVNDQIQHEDYVSWAAFANLIAGVKQSDVVFGCRIWHRAILSCLRGLSG
ncbi:hypothetical protein [Bradyrhizobium sp. th.b2]|uniref:hypothetical protein n=1 Tax=Bradyrhizobium sp. th-b2 TaxID=172088 RepID=UPI001FD9BE33|nr:hypothetical protein [Bradyrhizobium sp. th.b2]